MYSSTHKMCVLAGLNRDSLQRDFVGDARADAGPFTVFLQCTEFEKNWEKLVKNNYRRKHIGTVDLSIRVQCIVSLMCDSGLLEMNPGSVNYAKNVIKIKSGNRNLGSLSRYFQK